MLVQKIKDDMKAAMKARDDLRVQTLRMAIAAFTNELVAKGRKPTDDLDDTGASGVLRRLVKQRKEAAEQYTKGGRGDLADKESREREVIESYLPKMLSREEIEKVARAKKEELGIVDASGTGKLVGAVMKALAQLGHAANVDGNVVKEIINGMLT